ncbi:hypothetical protein IFM89_030528 [Coptis chinensis]|uniref:DUF659 domain-containing protein n=1 Tax=Coptis chinensis TaxID=261450 RepID=A0A835HNC9_9MAGN|nr:hypothetical protein IFM89_030528 [Coptis chinensis]
MDVVGCTLVPEDVQAEAVLLVKEKERPNKKLKTGEVQHEGTHHDFSALRQTTVPSMCDKKDKEHVDHALGHFFFDNNIAFNVIQSQSFIDFCIALSNYGSGFKVPSYSTLRTKLVQNAKAEVVEYVSQVKNSCSQIGSSCTLMSDGWTDLKGRCFINMIMYSPKELREYEERGNGDVELAIPNEATGNANDATSNATPLTRDDIIFEELFGSSM